MCTGKTWRSAHDHRRDSGSPPCARGGLFLGPLEGAFPRFTPVCTGRTVPRTGSLPQPSVHPRVHGDDQRCDECRADVAGSPPCARGRRKLGLNGRIAVRFTPVCTGKTDRQGSQSPPIAVHPRVHGEDGSNSAPARPNSGSPPCARGRRRRRRVPQLLQRFTPVCTGKTLSGRREGGVSPRFTPVCTGKTDSMLTVQRVRPPQPPLHALIASGR